MIDLGTARSAVDSALEAAIPVSFSAVGHRLRRAMWSWGAATGDLSGRVLVVTGATSGLGYQTAAELLAAGAEVDIVGRDRGRTDAAAARLAVTTGSVPAVRIADMGDLDAVRELVDELVAAHGHIDGVVHNAGAVNESRRLTTAGIEATWATMVAGPHLLTRTLGDRLADHIEGARIVWVTSGGMYAQRLHLDDTDCSDGDYSPMVAYSRAKRAQVDLVAEYARRLLPSRSTAVVAVHPGWADTPGVETSLPTFHTLLGPVLRTAAEGADSTVWAVAGTDPVESGRLYFDRRARSVSRLPRTATSAVDRAALWDLVEGQCGLV